MTRGYWQQNREHREHRAHAQVRGYVDCSRLGSGSRTSGWRSRTLALPMFAIWVLVFAVTQATANTNACCLHAVTCRFAQPSAMFAMFAVSRQYQPLGRVRERKK